MSRKETHMLRRLVRKYEEREKVEKPTAEGCVWERYDEPYGGRMCVREI